VIGDAVTPEAACDDEDGDGELTPHGDASPAPSSTTSREVA